MRFIHRMIQFNRSKIPPILKPLQTNIEISHSISAEMNGSGDHWDFTSVKPDRRSTKENFQKNDY